MAGMGVNIAGLSARHPDGTEALDAVDLDIAPGTFCAVMGPSGSGKSSLLATIGGRLNPRNGTIRLDGVELGPRTLPRLRPCIGQVFQDHRLVAQASALANVLAGAAPSLPLWRIVSGQYPAPLVARARDLLRSLGLDDACHGQRAGALSGGQAQRVGIARALVGNPALVLVDEPVSSLDPATARQALQVIAACAAQSGATVICALHQPDLAASFAGRIIEVDRGQIVADLAVTEWAITERSITEQAVA